MGKLQELLRISRNIGPQLDQHVMSLFQSVHRLVGSSLHKFQHVGIGVSIFWESIVRTPNAFPLYSSGKLSNLTSLDSKDFGGQILEMFCDKKLRISPPKQQLLSWKHLRCCSVLPSKISVTCWFFRTQMHHLHWKHIQVFNVGNWDFKESFGPTKRWREKLHFEVVDFGCAGAQSPFWILQWSRAKTWL